MLETTIRQFVEQGQAADRDAVRAAFAELRAALSAGTVRAAERDAASATGWRVNTWVKQGILLGFKYGDLADASADQQQRKAPARLRRERLPPNESS